MMQEGSSGWTKTKPILQGAKPLWLRLIERWIDDVNALKARRTSPSNTRSLSDLKEAREAISNTAAPSPHRPRSSRSVHRGEGRSPDLSACDLAGRPGARFTQSRRRQRRINSSQACHRYAALCRLSDGGLALGENKNTVQRIFQLKRWQVRKRRSGHRPRVQSLPSAASRPNERWATDMARVRCGEEHRWCALTVVMDCFTRELLGWRLSPLEMPRLRRRRWRRP